MEKNAFDSNLAMQGGAIYIQNSELNLFNNEFDSNRAEAPQ